MEIDLDQEKSEAIELVSDLFRYTIGDYSISWDISDQVDTNDPFSRVNFRETTIIFLHDPFQNPYFFLDLARAITFASLDSIIPNTWSRWNFATLTTLLIVPSTKISASKKTQYRKQWIDNENTLVPGKRKYNYLRWYQVLSAYNRTSVVALLREFIDELPVEVKVEAYFVSFLHQLLTSYFNEDDIHVMKEVLSRQTMEVSILMEYLPQLSRSKLYRIISRLSFHVDEYLIPNLVSYGLVNVIFSTDKYSLVNELQHSPYYENTETFKDIDKYLVKYWFPADLLDHIISSISLNGDLDLFIKKPNTKIITMAPGMYNSELDRWQSVKDQFEPPIVIEEPDIVPDTRPSSDQLDLLIQMIRSKTTDFRKLSLHHSHHETKQLLRDIKDQAFYYKMVLWRPPSDLQTITFFLPLTDWQTNNQTSFGELLFTEIQPKPTLIPHLDKILESSWPYTARDQVIQVKNNNTFRFGVIMRIVGRADDLLTITTRIANIKDALIGVNKKSPGSFVTIPLDKYDNGDWDFDTKQLISVLNNENRGFDDEK